jgi:DNA-binding NtrC family response regulator
LRDRKDDIHLLFRKFAADLPLKYKMPPLKLDEGGASITKIERNIRQLRNVAEQFCFETNRDITVLQSYLPSRGKFTFCDKNKKKARRF